MKSRFAAGLAGLSTLLVGTPTVADTGGSYTLSLVVPVDCRLQHSAEGAGIMSGDAFALGEINEYCNNPAGYEIVVNYTPGTLQGAVLSAGEDRVVLNGSGEAVLSRAPGPRIRERMLTATPGHNGFDTNQLDLRIQPV